MRAPTEKQYRHLLILGSGAAQVIGTKREIDPFLRRGWVTAQPAEPPYPYKFIRITPDGLRAVALGVEKYGLPPMRADTQREDG